MESTGSISYWLKAISGTNLQAGIVLSDSNSGGQGEVSTMVNVPADDVWRKYEWFLDEPNDWFAFTGADSGTSAMATGTGAIEGDYFAINALRLTGGSDALFYFDNVQWNPSAAVPEPAGFAVAALGGLALLRRGRRARQL